MNIYNIVDIKSLAQSLNAALDLVMENLPIQAKTQHFSKEKILSCTSAMKGILSGNGDQLWESVEKGINTQTDELKKSTSSLKSKLAKFASSYLKKDKDSFENKSQESSENDKSVLLKKIEAKDTAIDNMNAEILQLEAENEALQATPLPTVRQPSTAERNARISLKQKQQGFSNLNAEYDKMRRDFSIQIQQNSQGIEKSKRDIEKLECQINTIQSRINLMNKTGSLPKRSLQEINKTPKLSQFNRTNGSNLPTLSFSTQCNVIGTNNTDDNNMLPSIKNDDNYEPPRKPSSQPQQYLKEYAFNRTRNARASAVSDSNPNLPKQPQQQQQPPKRIPRNRFSTEEKDKTDKCLQDMSAAFLEAEQFLKEINALPNDNDTITSNGNDNILIQSDELKGNDNVSLQSKQNETIQNDNNDDMFVEFIESDGSETPPEKENDNGEDDKINAEIKPKPKPISESKSNPSSPTHKRMPIMPKTPNNSNNPRNQRRRDDISFMPISEEEMKKVARPLTCNESEKPGKRIPLSLREGYEMVFFHIAERIPKLA